MKRYDKSLTEVWEWKDKVFRDYRGMKNKDMIKKLKENADKILQETSTKLPTVTLRKTKKVA